MDLRTLRLYVGTDGGDRLQGFQGVFGFPTGIVITLIMIFIVFGSVLQASGAGESLIRIAFALTGRTRGPAHAAIVRRNVRHHVGQRCRQRRWPGVLTIPMIKRRGFASASRVAWNPPPRLAGKSCLQSWERQLF